MEALLTVEFVAEAAGDYVAELQVVSELNVATLVCSAKVAVVAAGPAVDAAAAVAEAAAAEVEVVEAGAAAGVVTSEGGAASS
jgi:hypothetical protein